MQQSQPSHQHHFCGGLHAYFNSTQIRVCHQWQAYTIQMPSFLDFLTFKKWYWRRGVKTQKPFHLRMAHFPTFKILVYRTLQNAIQPPSAGKKIPSPRLGLSSAVPQVQLRPSVQQGGTKAKSLQKSWLHFQLWTTASLRTKWLMSCTQETCFYFNRDNERHPTNDTTVASVICGTSPQYSGLG